MTKDQYLTKKVTYLVPKAFYEKFTQACKEHGKLAGKLKRNWAINFMNTNDPNGQGLDDEIKMINNEDIEPFEGSQKAFQDQVYFSTIDEKTNFIKYCDLKSISYSDFFRTCEYNYIKTGDPTGKLLV